MTPRALALQGIGHTARSAALQGFYTEAATGWDTAQGMAGYTQRLKRERRHAARLALDDQEATDFIMTLVFSEILYVTGKKH